MIDADDFLVPARERGLDFYTCVPCSFLTSMIDRVISSPELDYVAAASEGEAVAIAAGAWLAGRRHTAVICQNSGLGNAVNPLASLNHPFRIPALVIVTWRGEPGLADEPQHELMGAITAGVLALLRIPHRPFPRAREDLEPALSAAFASMETSGRPFALVLEKGSVRSDRLDQEPFARRERGELADLRRGGDPPPARIEVLERFLSAAPAHAAVIASTGKCGRELYTLDDRPQHLYQVGSMGCASGMALGVALNTERPVIVLDGDGAALMKLGTLATIGAYAPRNLVHVILDNGVHDSTGGQATVSGSVDFPGVALACGYAGAALCDDPDGFERALRDALDRPGPRLIHVRIRPGSIPDLGRPRVKPCEVAERFRAFIAGGTR